MNVAKQADDSRVLFVGEMEWQAIKLGLYLVTTRLDRLSPDYDYMKPIAAQAREEMISFDNELLGEDDE